MLTQIIRLRDDDPDITLTTYVADEPAPVRDAILVIPGGGYGCVCDDREGEPIALAYLALGVNAFVLKYSVGRKACFPRPLVDASLAMQHIRKNAAAYHVDPERIFTVGFSAGGHLAASLGTFWHWPVIREQMELPYGANKPAGMILCYAVLTALNKAHRGSFQRILGTDEPTDAQLALYSIDKHIDERTVPAFLMHTANDEIVPVENALYTAEAMSQAGIPFELHIYPDAPHGVALGNRLTSRGRPGWENAAIAQWVGHSVAWMKGVRPAGRQ